MTTLYSCKSEIDHSDHTTYRITKFDGDMNVESSYILTSQGSIADWACSCPAGVRPSCRHRDMLPKFIARGAVNTFWMFDFDRSGWVSMDLEGDLKLAEQQASGNVTATEIDERMANLPEIRNPLVEYLVDTTLVELRRASSTGTEPSSSTSPLLRRF